MKALTCHCDSGISALIFQEKTILTKTNSHVEAIKKRATSGVGQNESKLLKFSLHQQPSHPRSSIFNYQLKCYLT